MRSLTIAVAWLAATLAAVGVSWLGVRTVVHDAVLAPPQIAVPASPVSTGTPPPTPPPTSASTPVPLTSRFTVAPTTTAKSTPTTTPAPSTTASSSSDVQSYSVPGGQVVLALTQTDATLVSATPANGYSVQVWQETGWLRVDFSNSAGTSTVFATWNGHPPSVQTYES